MERDLDEDPERLEDEPERLDPERDEPERDEPERLDEPRLEEPDRDDVERDDVERDEPDRDEPDRDEEPDRERLDDEPDRERLDAEPERELLAREPELFAREPELRDALVERLEPFDVLRELLDEERLEVVRDVPLRRSAAGISSLATAFASCGICFSRNFAIRSSSRRMPRASLAVSLSLTASARASMPV